MSGLEIVGAVAASLQLAGVCVKVSSRLLGIRGDEELLATIHADCILLLAEINQLMLELSPECRPAAHLLADRIHGVRNNIERKRKYTGFFKAIIIGTGNGLEYRDKLMFAMEQYQTKAAMLGNATLQMILKGQSNLPDQMDSIVRPVIHSLGRLELDIQRVKEENIAEKQKACHLLQEQQVKMSQEFRAIVMELKEERMLLRKDLAKFTLASSQQTVERPALVVDYGTMADYLLKTCQSGWPTDQDIWECFHDILATYFCLDAPVALREILDCQFETMDEWNETIWAHLTMYKLEYCIEGTRRRRWKYQLGKQLQLLTPQNRSNLKPVAPRAATEHPCGSSLMLFANLLAFLSDPVELPWPTSAYDTMNPNISNIYYHGNDGATLSAHERIFEFIEFSVYLATALEGRRQLSEKVLLRTLISKLPDPSKLAEGSPAVKVSTKRSSGPPRYTIAV